ncbi:MAG: hypothetical protein Q9207_004433 [Kuettlingeria erythrocarpa]
MKWSKGPIRILSVVVAICEAQLVNSAPSYPKDYLPNLLHKSHRRDSNNPNDQSWIKTWAAVGDSYAAGIGAGERLGGLGDYFCSRTNESYPNLINSDNRLGDPASRTFTFWACSGAKTPSVANTQVASLKDNSQQMITISTGGNDIGLVDILNHCIFQWNPSAFSTCNSYLKSAQETIDSDGFSNDLDALLDKAKGKLTADGIAYWTGYAQFFGVDDNQCDSVTWSFFFAFFRREYLTLERRTAMNSLVINVNRKILEAVQRAGDQFVFVDYDSYYQSTLARFCEKGYAEPFGNREGLLFYEYYTDDTVDPDTPDGKTSPPGRSGNPVMDGTFEGDINAMVKEFTKNNGSDVESKFLEAPLGNAQVNTNPSPEQKDVGVQVSVLPDSYGRVLHPRRGGHTLISNLVLWHMQAQRAKKLNQHVPDQTTDGDSCPKDAGPALPTPRCGEGSIAAEDSIVAMKQPGIETAYKSFCTEMDGVVVDTPERTSDVAPPPVQHSYGPDGTGEWNTDTQSIYLKVTLVDNHADSCFNGEYTLVDSDCRRALAALNDGCDTNTVTEKHGGTYNYRCLKYTLSGTGTPKYAPGWCGLHIIQYQKPDPSTDAYKFDIVMKDANGMVIGNTLGAQDARSPVSVAGFGGQLPNQLIVTAGAVDADPVRFAYGSQSWDSNDGSRCGMGAYDSGSRNGDCGFSC